MDITDVALDERDTDSFLTNIEKVAVKYDSSILHSAIGIFRRVAEALEQANKDTVDRTSKCDILEENVMTKVSADPDLYSVIKQAPALAHVDNIIFASFASHFDHEVIRNTKLVRLAQKAMEKVAHERHHQQSEEFVMGLLKHTGVNIRLIESPKPIYKNGLYRLYVVHRVRPGDTVAIEGRPRSEQYEAGEMTTGAHKEEMVMVYNTDKARTPQGKYNISDLKRIAPFPNMIRIVPMTASSLRPGAHKKFDVKSPYPPENTIDIPVEKVVDVCFGTEYMAPKGGSYKDTHSRVLPWDCFTVIQRGDGHTHSEMTKWHFTAARPGEKADTLGCYVDAADAVASRTVALGLLWVRINSMPNADRETSSRVNSRYQMQTPGLLLWKCAQMRLMRAAVINVKARGNRIKMLALIVRQSAFSRMEEELEHTIMLQARPSFDPSPVCQ